ncbi:MAG: uracil phosphoribosyltransferase [Selenomonadaceae bacterium]|nr:uracil phosphoribosyltransferase [Selenomonadaceae bacterium]
MKKLFEQAGVKLETTPNVHQVKNPLVSHKLTQLRDKRTSPKLFRELVDELAMLLTCEVAQNFQTYSVEIETPIKVCTVETLDEENFVVVPILRAGLAMASGVLKLLPDASIGHVGLFRDEKTFEPVEYYFKMPPNFGEKILLVVDPMLATGGSACAALDLLKARGAQKIYFLCLVSTPQGIKKLSEEHPDVEIFTAAIDEGLNEKCYIVPGLGDAGDRIFATL